MEPVRQSPNVERRGGAPITKAQIAKIWASACRLGLDREMLYLLVPRGSISALSHREASELIERLAQLGARGGPQKTRAAPSGADAAHSAQPSAAMGNVERAATQEQRNLIWFLFGRLGWIGSPARVGGFLRKFAGVDSVEAIKDRKRAAAIIEALKAIHKRQKNANAP